MKMTARSMLCCTLVLTCTSTAVVAGPLDPPAGPIAPSGKTLPQVEPRVAIGPDTTPGDDNSVYMITEPGSYYLTGNLDGTKGKSGIKVEIPFGRGVTIDLNGFSMSGLTGSGGGIVSESAPLIIRNGLITDWPGAGVETQGSVILEHATVSYNGLLGVSCGRESLISDCNISHNGLASTAYGVAAGDRSMIRDCTVSVNSGGGIVIGPQSQIRGCNVFGNALGIPALFTGWGIDAAADCVITECRVDANGTFSAPLSGGIRAEAGSTVSQCELVGDKTAIYAGSYTRITNNKVRDALANGVSVFGARAYVDSNVVSNCSAWGVFVEAGASTVTRNVCTNNSFGNYGVAGGTDIAPVSSAAAATSPLANISN